LARYGSDDIRSQAALGEEDGVFYALGCNASGVAMMSYLRREIARRALGTEERKSAFETTHFPEKWWYRGLPWFVTPLTMLYIALDAYDRF
jgi:hypothetical protein